MLCEYEVPRRMENEALFHEAVNQEVHVLNGADPSTALPGILGNGRSDQVALSSIFTS